ncbi:hypothetical protein MTO96_034736 [Rhipicephalus appendiculatus]
MAGVTLGPANGANVRLCANEPTSRVAEEVGCVGGPMAVNELDLTNCISVYAKEVLPQIAAGTMLRCLRCAACPLPAAGFLGTVMWKLPYLVEVEYSFPAGSEAADWAVRRMFKQQSPLGGFAVNVRRMYFEVGCERDVLNLSHLLRYCPHTENVHVHLVRGEFHSVVQECHTLVKRHKYLSVFTFTSEVPSPIQCDQVTRFDFPKYAALCANVTYQETRRLASCFLLRNLARLDVVPQDLPSQLVVAAVHHDMTMECISFIGITHVWTHVRQLCILLLPQAPSVFYPAADGTYRGGLRVLCSALKHLAELNLSSFHFGPDIDVTALLQDGSLGFLQSLSAPPCGFRRVSDLRCLAACCPDLKELDVRFERKGSFRRCLRCEGNTAPAGENGAELCDSASPVFRNGLASLTLYDVRDAACMWFIKCCKPTATLRMAYCPWDLDCAGLCRALAESSSPSCLILRHHGLRLDDPTLLDNLGSVADLQYLYLLSGAPLSYNSVWNSVKAVLGSLPRLKCLHVHYQNSAEHGICETLTWMRRNTSASSWPFATGGANTENVVRGGPCFLCCSTATFIGLAKPRGRNIQPVL